MTYTTPTLQLVGAAQGLVLGAASALQFDCREWGVDNTHPQGISRATADF